MVTIQDVARVAGVSPMTVSNVINDRPHVRPATRQKVVDAMTDLDYRVNRAARNLRAGRTFTIGLAVVEIDRPYWGQLAARIIQEAARHGLEVAIEQTGASRESELDALSLSRNRMYDGLILSTVGLGPDDIDKLKVDYPIVILGERLYAGAVDHVAMANVDGARAATRHLVEQGCRRIAFMDNHHPGETDVSSLRYDGYRQALDEAGIPFDPELSLTLSEFSLAAGRAAGQRLATSGIDFDAVFCVTDTVAIGVLRGLADEGITVPRDVKVMGFDNIEESAYSIPSLTTIDPDHALMAKTAVELLVQRIAQPGPKRQPVEFISTYRVVERDSTAPSPGS